MSDEEKALVQQLRGRARFCRDRGEVKTPTLLEHAANEIEALQGASSGEGKKADPVNYKAWANNMITFIRERDLQVAFTDWCGGWPYPGKPTPAAATGGDVDGLLPCPFCGSAADKLVQAFTRVTDDLAFWSVECTGCGVEVADDASQAEADRHWNTRATLSPSDRDMRDGWEPIETVDRNIHRCLLWCADVDTDGNPVGCVFGRVFFYSDAIVPRGDGMHGEWNFTHYQLPPAPPSQTVKEG